MPDARAPEIVTGKLAYVRFHGPDGKYRGSYPDAEMRRWAGKLKAWEKPRRPVYAYFNNDIGGFAPRNARTLQRFLGEL